jgi:hypothetical protein
MNELSVGTLGQMERLTKRLQNDPRFMAWVLDNYKRQERINDQTILTILNTNSEGLSRLLLCLCPDTQSDSFANQVRLIGEYTQIDPIMLAKIVRQVKSLQGLSNHPVNRGGVDNPVIQSDAIFSAARDRVDNEYGASNDVGSIENQEKKETDDGMVG